MTGDPAGTLYYVVNGSVSIITEEDDGRELVLGYLGTGEFVGTWGTRSEPISPRRSSGPNR